MTLYEMAHEGDQVRSVHRQHVELRLTNPQGNVLLSPLSISSFTADVKQHKDSDSNQIHRCCF